MAPIPRPVYPYRKCKINRIPVPLPTAAEITTAIRILSQTLNSLHLEYGLVSSAAIFLHGTYFSLPCLLPSTITVLIQPSAKLSALEINQLLCSPPYDSSYVPTRKNGIDAPKIIIKRTVGGRRGDLFVDFEIVDHYVCWEKRSQYDFRRNGNAATMFSIGSNPFKFQVPVLNPPWLLKQTIQRWNARSSEEQRERRNDEIDIRTLVDVLSYRKSGKITVSGKEEVEQLRALIWGMNGDDPHVLGSVIDCPEIFGPWWRVNWVLVVGALLASAVLLFVCGWMTAEGRLGNEERNLFVCDKPVLAVSPIRDYDIESEEFRVQYEASLFSKQESTL
ncbi:hypothetical protein BUE80_DR012445 [Diplocarpon rosae]|nr:hypothetical protein BUE80_DR012445 [Diplocarpon rosae]